MLKVLLCVDVYTLLRVAAAAVCGRCCCLWQVAEQHVRAVFFASLAGTQPYPARGTQFELVEVELLGHDGAADAHAHAPQELEAAYARCRAELERRGRSGAELEEKYAFVGCRCVGRVRSAATREVSRRAACTKVPSNG